MKKFTNVLDRGRQIIDLTKIGTKIEKETDNIEKLYANLGRVFYKVHDKAPEIMYDDIFRAIDGAERELKHLKKEYQLVSTQNQCQRCEKTLSASDAYCPSCGHAVVCDID